MVGAVDEVITIAEQAKLTGIVTHMKALGTGTWGKSAEAVKHIEAARARGVMCTPINIPTRRAAPASPARSCRDGRRCWAIRR